MSDAIYETDSIDRLFLALSQFTKAKTAKELKLERDLAAAKELIAKLQKETSILGIAGEVSLRDAIIKDLENRIAIEKNDSALLDYMESKRREATKAGGSFVTLELTLPVTSSIREVLHAIRKEEA